MTWYYILFKIPFIFSVHLMLIEIPSLKMYTEI